MILHSYVYIVYDVKNPPHLLYPANFRLVTGKNHGDQINYLDRVVLC